MTVREVAYRFHPWYGQDVVVIREINKGGQSFVHGHLVDSELILAVPSWMFEEALCSSFRELDTPEVDCKAIHQLRVLLQDAGCSLVQQEHSNTNSGGNAHGKSEPRPDHSNGSISSPSDPSSLGSVASGDTKQDA